jgi:hypothetical protein
MPTAEHHQPSATFPVDLSLGLYDLSLYDLTRLPNSIHDTGVLLQPSLLFERFSAALHQTRMT